MDDKLKGYRPTCPHCGKELNSWMMGNFKGGRFLNKRLNTFRSKCFCTKECYEDYKKDFIVEVYNSQPVYCVVIDEEERFMPYFEANYYFTNIDDCKKRMDMKGVAVMV